MQIMQSIIKDNNITYGFTNMVNKVVLLCALFVMPSIALAESVCAVVKIEIQQELTLERQAFDAVMKINNGLDTLPIENVAVNVTFADEAGNSVLASSDPNSTDAKFFIRIDSMTGITDVSGGGVIQPLQTAEVHWLIIPAPGSANDIPSGTLYYVGASLSYTLGGEEQTTVVTPDFIYVKPLPLLTLDYFLTQDVFADDPFTAPIEPSEPFTLGVRVQNNGGATARNVKIDSAQPEIIENEQGLLINFLIIGSSVNDQPATSSLLINLGDVNPNESTVGRWDMLTTLEGKFTDFTATFSHADDLGGELTSIIDAANTHFLVRNVLVDAPGRDSVRDFLALDGDTLRVYESDSVDTVVTDQSTSASFPLLSTNGVETIHALNAPVTAGLMYVKLNDPYNGFKVIKEVIRSDGKRLPLDNVWFSKKKDVVTKVRSYFINLFDNNSTGQYTIILENSNEQPEPPVLQAIPDRVVVEGQQIGFIIEASDQNGDIPAITATGLPAGAIFTDLNSGTANFSWFTQLGQAGSYAITYTATDNTGLTSSRVGMIKVNPIDDTDGDGLLDEWELDNFGDLSHDGTADSDGDGVSDLQEFENGTDPNLPPPAIPGDLAGEPLNQGVTLSWSEITDATTYNLYWSDVSDVTKTTGTLIESVASPYEHPDLTNDETYYYVITSVGPGGESDISAEISVIAGIRDWETPQIIEQLSTGNAEYPEVAARADGQAIAVWQQTEDSLTTLWANRFVPTIGWSTAIQVSSNSTGAVGDAQVVMDSSGNAIAVWAQQTDAQSNIWANRFDAASSSWSTATLIGSDSLTDAVAPQISMQSDGRAAVVWSQAGNAVWSNLYIPASGWSTAERIETDTALSVANVQVELDVSGNALAVWSSTADGSDQDIRSNRYIAGTGWDAPQTVRSAITGDTLIPTIRVSMGMSAIGNAVAVWNEFDGTVTNIWSSQFDKTTGWASATTIENDNAGSAYVPRVSVDSTGNAAAIWQQSNGARTDIFANQYSAIGGWGNATLIESNDNSDATRPTISLTPRGQIVASWSQLDGIQDNLWANTFTPGKGWQSAEIIETENAGSVNNAQLARDNRGDVFAVWQQSNELNNNVWFNRFALGNAGVPNISPVIVTGANQVVDEGATVNLDASASFDQDGTIATYAWIQTASIPTTLTSFDTSTTSFVSPTLVTQETLSFTVTVTDNEGGISTHAINITVNPVNAAPLANAGLAQAVEEQTDVNLIGSGTDTDGSIVTYEWTQINGDVVAISNASTANANFTAPTVLIGPDAPKVLTFSLTVTDNEAGTASSDVIVTVNPVNANPIANADVNQSVDEQTSVSLSGTGTDTDGSIATYQWSQVSGDAVTITNANAATANFTAPVVLVGSATPKVLTFRLTVTDNEGATAFSDTIITVNPVNAAPVADAGLSRMVEEQTSVTLSGSAIDTDGSVNQYSWLQLTGPVVSLSAANTATPSFTTPVVLVADSPTILNFQLTVTDNEGAAATSEVAIGVLAVNASPVSDAGTDQTTDEQKSLQLTGSGTDTDGTIVSYQWSQVSGTPVTLLNANTASINFTTPVVLVGSSNPGLLTFRLIVTDNEGGTASDDIIVSVNAVNESPTANANVDQFVDEQTTVSLNGSGADTDGNISAYSWVQLSGTPVTLSTPFSANASFVAPTLKSVETLTFRLTVIDNETYTASDDIQIVVNPVNTAPIAIIEPDQVLNENSVVTLDGSASNDPDADGAIVVYAWGQISGPTVLLNNADSAIASFTAPAVYENTVFSFRFAIVDDEGGDAVVSTNVLVRSTNPDDDADGLLDLWEIQYFGNLDRDGTQDFDGDGATDLQEHGYNTDPTVAQSPGRPEIVSPDDIEVSIRQPVLTLINPDRHSGFPVSYQFEIYRDAAMSQQAAAATVETLTWPVSVVLEDNTHYYWRARANGSALFSEWVSSTFFVNTVNDAPSQPQISYPQDGVWVNSFTPELSVNNSSDIDEDALTYQFEVFSDDTLTMLVAASADIPAGGAGSTSWLVDTPLLENNEYVWRVVVTDEHGLSTASPTARIFINTINDSPSVPGLIAPADNSEISTLETSIVIDNSIEPEAEPVHYYFELDKVNTFDSQNKRVSGVITEGINQTSWYVNGLDDNNWYYWRVKASDGRAESTWLQGRFFVNTVNDAPSVPTIDNPGDNAWVGTIEPTLSVFPATDIDGDVLSYEFEVYAADSSGTLGALLLQAASATTYWQVTPALPEDGWYYWRARAVDEHGLPGEWALPVIFFADTDGVNDVPSIKLKKLEYDDEHDDDDEHHYNDYQQVEISWQDTDQDSNAFISFYYDTDQQGEDGINVVEGLREDPDGIDDNYLWDVSTLPAGVYFVYAVIDDGNTRVVQYSENAIVIGNGGGKPYLEFDEVELDYYYKGYSKIEIEWKDLDADNNAQISLYYDTDKIGFDGNLIVGNLQEDPDGDYDEYDWYVNLPIGKYYIYAVISDGVNTFSIYSDDAIDLRSDGDGYDKDDD